MQITEERIREIIEKVVISLNCDQSSTGGTKGSAVNIGASSPLILTGRDGVFDRIDSAIGAASLAQQQLLCLSLTKRNEIIEAIRQVVIASAERFARDAVAETALGRVSDKINKNLLVARKTPGVEDLRPSAFTGDDGLTLIERAPYGIIAAITPSTNPTETVINNGIGMIAAGNAVVFNPHPSAKKVTLSAIQAINRAIVSVGGPANLFTSVAEPTMDTSNELMNHPKIRLVVVTGGPGVVAAAMKTGKKVIAGGPGNPPTVVDESADINKAAQDIIAGASLDNNIVCIAEKEIFALNSIADPLISAMERSGAYRLDNNQRDQLTQLLIKDGRVNRKFVGKNASVIMNEIGIKIPDDIRLILCEAPKDHPFVLKEMLLPVMPLVRVPDINTAISWAVEAEGGCYHTATMHSKNVEHLHRMACAVNTSIFVKNGPSYAGLGMGGEGFTSFTIASPTGEGLTRARTFTRERRCVLVDYFRIV